MSKSEIDVLRGQISDVLEEIAMYPPYLVFLERCQVCAARGRRTCAGHDYQPQHDECAGWPEEGSEHDA
jgi:hypothetical protein